MDKDIRLVKAVTANVNGKTYELPAGRQRVPAEVADHWFVKAHTDNDSTDETGDTRDMQILELSTQNGQLREQLQRAEDAARTALNNEGKVEDLSAQLQGVTAERDRLAQERNDLAKKVADLQATIDLSAAPGETKSAAQSTAKTSNEKHKG